MHIRISISELQLKETLTRAALGNNIKPLSDFIAFTKQVVAEFALYTTGAFLLAEVSPSRRWPLKACSAVVLRLLMKLPMFLVGKLQAPQIRQQIYSDLQPARTELIRLV